MDEDFHHEVLFSLPFYRVLSLISVQYRPILFCTLLKSLSMSPQNIAFNYVIETHFHKYSHVRHVGI